MASRSGRKLAICSAAIALGGAAAAGVTLWEAIVERYYVSRLQSSEEATRIGAAEKLVAMLGLEAAPYLIRVIQWDEREGAFERWETNNLPSPVHNAFTLTPLAYALYQMGDQALSRIEAALEECERAGRTGTDRLPAWKNPGAWWALSRIRIALKSRWQAERLTYEEYLSTARLLGHRRSRGRRG